MIGELSRRKTVDPLEWKQKLARWGEILLDCFLIFLFAAALIRPLFKAAYLDKWASIESSFIADARFLIAHWPHPQWQPLWYAGTRFDYVYPPALRYGTALISMADRLLAGAGLPLLHFVFLLRGDRGSLSAGARGDQFPRHGVARGIATALMSPSFLFLTNMRNDAWQLLPARLGVLAKYGEGPHMTALALIPIALAFTWLALDAWRPCCHCAGSGVLRRWWCRIISMARSRWLVFYPILVWSFWITRQDKRIRIPAVAIPLLTYGLTAFWLVPSYFKVTADNLKYVSEHGTTWSIWLAVAVAIAFRHRVRPPGARQNGPHLGGLHGRLRGLLFAERAGQLLLQIPRSPANRCAWRRNWTWSTSCSARPSSHGCGTAWRWTALDCGNHRAALLRHHRAATSAMPGTCFRSGRITRTGSNIKITDWVSQNMPDSRIMPSGSVRFWYRHLA